MTLNGEKLGIVFVMKQCLSWDICLLCYLLRLWRLQSGASKREERGRNTHTDTHMHREKTERCVSVPEFCLEDRDLNTTTSSSQRYTHGFIWCVCVLMLACLSVYGREKKRDDFLLSSDDWWLRSIIRLTWLYLTEKQEALLACLSVRNTAKYFQCCLTQPITHLYNQNYTYYNSQ